MKMSAATTRQSAGQGASGILRVFPWLALLLGIVGLLASFYCFYKAQALSTASSDRQQQVQQMQRASMRLRTEWLGGNGLDSMAESLDNFQQAQEAHANALAGDFAGDDEARLSTNVETAFAVWQESVPPSSFLTDDDAVATDEEAAEPPVPGNNDIAGNARAEDLASELVYLVEVTAALRARLALIDAPDVQVEPAGHLYQLAVTVRKKLVLDPTTASGPLGDIRATRGPWLVFDQILQRVEAMIGTQEIIDENAVALASDVRARQVALENILQPVFAGKSPLPARKQPVTPTAEVITPVKKEQPSARAKSEALMSSLATRHNLLDDSLDSLQTEVASGRHNHSLWLTLGLLSGLVGTAILTLLALGLLRNLKHERQKREVTDDRHEESIQRLLDEISQLAEGDLSTRATVTEGITGSIADSVNYAVTELRRLVGTMSTSAERVQVAVEETGTTARQLANASVVQSREISRSSAYTTAMADTMGQLSTRVSEASAIAQQSVSLSVSARNTVEQTEGSVDNVKHKTAEASRVMQRLGDSSSQISRSIKLMDQVAEKTRLLAMNTAIRARSSDASGALANDMSEVAEQVRGLANRLGQSAGEIETLVSVVQQDVSATIDSLRGIDTEVNRVAVQAADAGNNLQQIEAVSERLSRIVETIDERMQRQSKVIKQLSGNMGVINDVTRHSAHGLQLSASALEDLRLMASELKDGVAEFSLPEKDRHAIAKRTEAIRNHVHVGVGSETMAVRVAVGENDQTLTPSLPSNTPGKRTTGVDHDRFDERTIAIENELTSAMNAEREERASAGSKTAFAEFDHDRTQAIDRSVSGSGVRAGLAATASRKNLDDELIGDTFMGDTLGSETLMIDAVADHDDTLALSDRERIKDKPE